MDLTFLISVPDTTFQSDSEPDEEGWDDEDVQNEREGEEAQTRVHENDGWFVVGAPQEADTEEDAEEE